MFHQLINLIKQICSKGITKYFSNHSIFTLKSFFRFVFALQDEMMFVQIDVFDHHMQIEEFKSKKLFEFLANQKSAIKPNRTRHFNPKKIV